MNAIPTKRCSQQWDRAELLSLLSSSATLAGLCITIAAFMNTFNKTLSASTLADELFGLCATGFLVCVYLIFWALKTSSAKQHARWTNVAHSLFLGAMTLMTFAGFMLICSLF